MKDQTRIGQSKLRFFCGLCNVSCKDENGYKCHLKTDKHIQLELYGRDSSSRQYQITEKDKLFREKFLDHLVKRHFGQTVLAHDIYQELHPNDRPHSIMKTTCWQTLGSFVAYLRTEGKVEAQKGTKGWMIRVSQESAFIDSEPDPVPLKKKIKLESLSTETPVIETKQVPYIPPEPSNRDTRIKVSFKLGKKDEKRNIIKQNDSESD